MKARDKQAFAQTLTAIADLYGKDISDAGLGIWWSALEHYSLAQIQQALSNHARDPDRGAWMPKPADVVRQIEGGRPSPDEIIAMALNPTTPIGVLCRMEIGTWNLQNWTAEKLRPLAQVCIHKLPDWHSRIKADKLLGHERRAVAKYVEHRKQLT
jgi:hypothetical protein